MLLYLGVSSASNVKQWKWAALVASAIFYGYWDWRFLGLIYGLTIMCWYCGLKMVENRGDLRKQKHWLMLAVTSSLLVLGTFKYFNFFIGAFTDLFDSIGRRMDGITANVILPVGISC